MLWIFLQCVCLIYFVSWGKGRNSNVSCVAKIIDLTETNSYPYYKQFFNNNKIFRNIAIREPFIYCTFKQKTIYMMVSTFEHPSYKQVIATNMRNGNAREKLWESLQVILLTFFFVSVLFCSERNDFFKKSLFLSNLQYINKVNASFYQLSF